MTELEETVKLYLLLQNSRYTALNGEEIAELKNRFGITNKFETI